MKIDFSPRQSGKTARIIKWSAETGGYIVCINRQECHRVFDMAKKMKLKIPLPISANEFLLGQYYPGGVKRLAIDNADLLLQQLSKVKLDWVSLTNEYPQSLKDKLGETKAKNNGAVE